MQCLVSILSGYNEHNDDDNKNSDDNDAMDMDTISVSYLRNLTAGTK